MTLKQAINLAKKVTISFHPSNGVTSEIKISKTQAHKLINENHFDFVELEGHEIENWDDVLWYGNYQGEIVASYNKKYFELSLGV
tara:strand:- start:142 stop:396 length:255 start_codon:yes stop_codon:yes gene_type:complete